MLETLLAEIPQDLVSAIAIYNPAHIAKNVKSALEAAFADCDTMGRLYASLLKLLKTYSVDLLAVPLGEHFKKTRSYAREEYQE